MSRLHFRADFPRAIIAWSALAACCLQAGCFLQDLRGPGYRDDLQPLGQRMRPDSPRHELWGFDKRSRQTEENLGK